MGFLEKQKSILRKTLIILCRCEYRNEKKYKDLMAY